MAGGASAGGAGELAGAGGLVGPTGAPGAGRSAGSDGAVAVVVGPTGALGFGFEVEYLSLMYRDFGRSLVFGIGKFTTGASPRAAAV